MSENQSTPRDLALAVALENWPGDPVAMFEAGWIAGIVAAARVADDAAGGDGPLWADTQATSDDVLDAVGQAIRELGPGRHDRQ